MFEMKFFFFFVSITSLDKKIFLLFFKSGVDFVVGKQCEGGNFFSLGISSLVSSSQASKSRVSSSWPPSLLVPPSRPSTQCPTICCVDRCPRSYHNNHV